MAVAPVPFRTKLVDLTTALVEYEWVKWLTTLQQAANTVMTGLVTVAQTTSQAIGDAGHRLMDVWATTLDVLTSIVGPLTDRGGQVYNVKAFGLTGDGTTNDATALSSLISTVAALTFGGVILFPAGTYRLAANITTPAKVAVVFLQGSMLSVDNGYVATFNGAFSAAHTQTIMGAGPVVFGRWSIDQAYPEWWGIDGVNDDEQINLALTASNVVKLAGTRYYISSKILPRSNNILIGQGRDVTWLDWSGGNPGNQGCHIEVLNKTNVKLAGFSLDSQSADATVPTGSGIRVDDGSSNICIDDVHAFDCYFNALIINTGHDIHVSRFKASFGTLSSTVLVGQFPAAYGLTVNKDCTDIFFDDITIEDVQTDAFGIWNCSGGDGYTSKCARINTNGLIVKRWGRAGLGMAYWGSGIGSAPDDVNLVNFNFDNLGAGNTNMGRGLHLEHGTHWNHSNGTIRNLVSGGADDRQSYAISCSGGSSLSYSNIEIYLCGIGVLANLSQNARFTNIVVNYGKYCCFYVAGTGLHFTNCYGFTTGSATSTDLVWLFYAESPYTINDITLDNCYGYVSGPNDPATAAAITISAIAFHDLRITNFKTDNVLALNPGSYRAMIHGDTFSVKLRESVSAGVDYEIPVHISSTNAGRRICVLNAYLSFGSSIAVNATDYNTYKLIKRDENGVNPAELTTAGLVTKTDDLSVAIKPTRFPINGIAASHLGVGEILTLAKTHAGAGKAETDGMLTIEYMSY